MQISTSAPSNQSDEIRQVTLLKKAIDIDQTQKLALIESTKVSSPSQPMDTRRVGRLFNEKA